MVEQLTMILVWKRFWGNYVILIRNPLTIYHIEFPSLEIISLWSSTKLNANAAWNRFSAIYGILKTSRLTLYSLEIWHDIFMEQYNSVKRFLAKYSIFVTSPLTILVYRIKVPSLKIWHHNLVDGAVQNWMLLQYKITIISGWKKFSAKYSVLVTSPLIIYHIKVPSLKN